MNKQKQKYPMYRTDASRRDSSLDDAQDNLNDDDADFLKSADDDGIDANASLDSLGKSLRTSNTDGADFTVSVTGRSITIMAMSSRRAPSRRSEQSTPQTNMQISGWGDVLDGSSESAARSHNSHDEQNIHDIADHATTSAATHPQIHKNSTDAPAKLDHDKQKTKHPHGSMNKQSHHRDVHVQHRHAKPATTTMPPNTHRQHRRLPAIPKPVKSVVHHRKPTQFTHLPSLLDKHRPTITIRVVHAEPRIRVRSQLPMQRLSDIPKYDEITGQLIVWTPIEPSCASRMIGVPGITHPPECGSRNQLIHNRHRSVSIRHVRLPLMTRIPELARMMAVKD